MIIYDKEKSRAIVGVNRVSYMLNPVEVKGHELWINGEIFMRYDNQEDVIEITKQIIEALSSNYISFEI